MVGSNSLLARARLARRALVALPRVEGTPRRATERELVLRSRLIAAPLPAVSNCYALREPSY